LLELLCLSVSVEHPLTACSVVSFAALQLPHLLSGIFSSIMFYVFGPVLYNHTNLPVPPRKAPCMNHKLSTVLSTLFCDAC